MIKAKPCLLAALACVFVGCEMAEVVDWGADCPTDANLSLTYIGNASCTPDNASACQIDGKTYDFSNNFEIRRCPKEFSVCAVNDENSNYHCEKDTKKGCADTQLTCPRNDDTDDVDCIDPSSIKTCGASDCKSINYGGQDCSEYGELSRCQQSNDTGKYVCRCPSGALLCGAQCIDPNDPKYCGANDCDADNYGGIDCEKGDAYCTSGKCSCSAGSIWCSINGEPPRCISPRDNATCNAHLAADGNTCETTPCDENQTCSAAGDGSFTCTQIGCDSDQQLCDTEDGNQCIPRLDDDNCGVCNNKCSALLQSNAHGSECLKTDDGKYVCKFVCDEGFENCGTDTEPNCVSLNTFQHCGECNHTCGNNEACDPEKLECIPTGCAPNECPLSGKDGEESECVQEDDHCGKDCQVCSNIHTNASCQNGICVISACNDGEHPVYEETLIIRCEPNTINSCAPSDIKVNESPVDCVETLANAHEVMCTEEGKCSAVSCESGFHLNHGACVANTSTLCGSGDSSDVMNCNDEIENAAETECLSNICFAKKCAEGYHLSADLKLCEANDTSKCAPVDSKDAKDCSIVPNATQTECVKGVCKAKQCFEGYHLSTDKSECVANSNSLCAATDSNKTMDCTAIANAATAVCENGACTVNKCKENYHINKGNTACVVNTNTSCASTTSSKETDCQAIANASSTECAKGSCKVLECKSGFHVSPDNKRCVSNESTKCAPPGGGQEINCNDAIPSSAQTTCNAGVCEVVECAVDHHPSPDKKSCIKNTATACAGTKSSATTNCSTYITNSATTACTSGSCTVSKCNTGYHLNAAKTKCVANSNTACAATNSSNAVDCSTIANAATTACTAGACTVSNCKAGYHLNAAKTQCVANTAAACAATNSSTTTNCNTFITNSATTNCSNGTCYVSNCAGGYHLNSAKTQCVANSNTACAATNSSTTTNCTATIANAATTACTNGSCTVSKCNTGYHLNSAKTKCVVNSDTSCAATNSSSAVNCNTTITNSVTTACSSAGSCTVSKCASGYHLNSAKTKCVANSNTACASTTSSDAVNCSTSIKNSETTKCSSSGTCQVTKCVKNYHINSSAQTSCVKNTDEKCATPTSYSTKDCTKTYTKVCSDAGKCKCSSGVVNYDKNACVPKVCMDIPGVKEGKQLDKSWYSGNDEYSCNATSCNTDYKIQKQNNTDVGVCLPKDSTYNCIENMGYKYKDSSGYCVGRRNGNGPNGHAHCKDGYRQYIFACLPKDVCCGTRGVDMTAAGDYLCTNCKAKGQTCNLTSGKCE
ncbi:MAG: hypothetical protein IJM59_10855 [Proteobacteria bacterium]|nr:hypothetical protein [Pseudomonadota bacterium]